MNGAGGSGTRERPIAQTSLQLWAELEAAGWPADDLDRARRAFELAARVFGGRLRISGKSLLAHVVGVASIALRQGARREAVVAALLHSAYSHGDFGGATPEASREIVRDRLGNAVESIVAGYAKLPWNAEAVRARLAGERGEAPRFDRAERELLLLRLADALEDRLDGAPGYERPGARGEGALVGAAEKLLIELAHALDAHDLAEALASASASDRERAPAPELRAGPWAWPSARRPRQRVVLWRWRAGQGGAVRLMGHLARRLPRMGPEVVVTLAGARAGDATRWLRRQGVFAEELPGYATAGPLARMRMLVRHLREVRADVLNTHSEPALIEVLAARAAGVRCVMSPHVMWRPGWLERLSWRLAFRLCDRIVVADASIESHLRALGAPRASLRPVPSGIPVPRGTPARSDARRRLGIAPDALVVACAARLQHMKGLDVLIEAVARIPDPALRPELLVAGRGPQRQALEGLAARRLPGRVRFLGFLEDPSDLYAATDVFALALRREGGPVVLREAAMHGTACVATDAGATRGILHDGETGRVVPQDDPEALARVLGELLRDDAERVRLGRNARDWARRHSTADPMARRYAALLGELAPAGA